MVKGITIKFKSDTRSQASVTHLFDALLGRRPADNRHWQEKIRQVLQRGPFRNVGRGEWALAT